MEPVTTIAITGLGLEIPGWEDSASPLRLLDGPPVGGAFDPQVTLGKKGLRYKDRATLLALCAAEKAMRDRGLLEAGPEEKAGMGVCVSSNFGNIDTIVRESGVIRAEHVDATSPMSLPLASSNVTPASIAIRHGLKGINLMLCNGSTSGLDAVQAAVRALRSRRASRVIVVGVEPSNPWTAKLLAEADPEARGTAQPAVPGDMAAALILEPAETAPARRYGTLGPYAFVPPGRAAKELPSDVDAWFIPSQNGPRSREFVASHRANGMAKAVCLDATRHMGELYGALGVFQVLLAARHLEEAGKGRALVSNGLTFGDGLSMMIVNR